MFTVLMPVDGSESRGTAQADAVVRLPHAADDVRVVLLYVFEDRTEAGRTSPKQIEGGRAAHGRLRGAGVSIDELSRVGDPATEILAAAAETDANYIVLGGRKRSPLGSLLFGSVTQAVVLDADRPVAITGGAKASPS
jgi:nucleotide-binding universal stress UspA family protein